MYRVNRILGESENVWVSSVSVLLNVSYENRCGVTKEKKETSTWSVGKNP